MYLLWNSRGALRTPVEVRDQIHAAEAAAEAAAVAAAAPAAAAFVSALKEFDHNKLDFDFGIPDPYPID